MIFVVFVVHSWWSLWFILCDLPDSADAQEQLHRELIEPFVREPLVRERGAIERRPEQRFPLAGRVRRERGSTVAVAELGHHRLDVRVGIPAPGMFAQDQ